MRDKWRAAGNGQERCKAGERIADKRFFIGQWDARKNVIAPVGRIHAAPQFLAAIRHNPQSRRERAALKRLAKHSGV